MLILRLKLKSAGQAPNETESHLASHALQTGSTPTFPMPKNLSSRSSVRTRTQNTPPARRHVLASASGVQPGGSLPRFGLCRLPPGCARNEPCALFFKKKRF